MARLDQFNCNVLPCGTEAWQATFAYLVLSREGACFLIQPINRTAWCVYGRVAGAGLRSPAA
jgi:hypothetical protein